MNIEMILVTCASCNVPFCITQDMQDRLKKCHNVFYCPSGHQNCYLAETEEEKLRKQLNYKKNEIDCQNQEINRLKLERDKMQRSLKRKSTKKASHVPRHSSS